MATTPQKDTIYIDIDDEITAIIDKVKSSDKKIIALVLPKRAAVLQSIVNMKLLKRTTDEAKKSIVLITSEAGLLPLAGAVGIHVAKTLQSKPAIPAEPQTADTPISVNQDDIDDVELDKAKPIGQLAGEEEAIEVDNEDKPEAAALAGAAAAKKSGKRKIKIPNFDKFRLRIVLGVIALILLITGWIFAFQILPKAKVVIKTDAATVSSEFELTVSPTATELDEETGVVPGTLKEIQKTDTETVPATGEVDKGAKSTGTVEIYNCSESDKLGDVVRTVPAGTGVSVNNLTFITTETVEVEPSSLPGGVCNYNQPSDPVPVTAQSAGEKYNLPAKNDHSYNVAGFSSMSADGSSMTGGTSQIVKIVSQKDIDDAAQKIQDRSDAARDQLLADMEQDNLVGLRETFATKGEPVITSAPAVNAEASEVKVTRVVTYTLLGAQKDALKQLISKNVEDKIDTSKQVILDDGLDEAGIILNQKAANGDASITMKVQSLAGPQLDEESIKQEIAGKKKSQTLNLIKERPGIEDAEVSYSPFWVSSTPKKTSKITVVFEQNTDNGADEE